MLSAVGYVSARPAGGRRRSASPLLVALAALRGGCAGASAALPDLTDQVKVPVQLPLSGRSATTAERRGRATW